MTAITALNVRLGMDASNFSAGADLARTEVNRVSAIMRQSVSPAEKFKREVELLNKAFSESGKKTADFANAMEHLRKKYNQVDPAAKKASSSIDQIKQSMMTAIPGGQMFANMLKGPAGAMIALGAAAAIAIRGMKQAATRIDETAKAARSLGFAYRDLIGIQMLAGEVAGIDAASVNRGLGQFVKRLAEARVDGGRLKETMAAIGLDVNKLAASAPADAFKAVATAIAGIPDKAEQIRIATMLVGKEGVKMVELFRQGGDAIDKMTLEAERLQGTLSESAVASIESMNDALGRSKMAVDGIWNTMLAGVAPTIKSVADLASDFFVMIRQAGVESEKMVPIFTMVGAVVQKLADGFRLIIAFISDSISLFASLPKVLVGGKINKDMKEVNRLLDEMDAKSRGVATATQASTEAAEALAIEAERAAEAAKKQEETYEKRLRDLQIESVALSGNAELAERMKLATEGYSQAQIDTIQAMQQQNDLIKERIAAEEEAAKQEEKNNEEITKRFFDDVQKTKDKSKEIDDAFTIEVESAMKAAQEFFDSERQKDEERRKEVAQGPASMEVGSAEAAKFMADQANNRMAAMSVPVAATPGEKEIADKTGELLKAQRESNAKQQTELDTMKLLLVAFKENGFQVRRS